MCAALVGDGGSGGALRRMRAEPCAGATELTSALTVFCNFPMRRQAPGPNATPDSTADAMPDVPGTGARSRTGGCFFLGALGLGSLGLGALVCALGLSACGDGGPARHYRMPRLSPEEDRIRVYYIGDKPDCRYDELGYVDATSGELGNAAHAGSVDVTIALLKREAHKRGATGLILNQPTKSEDQSVVLGSGVAIRCAS